MTLDGLDDLDRCILHALQRDARHASSSDIAERMGVSPSTVRKRIDRLEEEGVVTGYRAEVDFERAGYQLRVQIVCSAPVTDREGLSNRALEVSGVVSVQEIATGTNNVLVSAIAEDNDDLTRIVLELAEVGLDVVDEHLVRREQSRSFSGFAVDGAED